MMVTEDPTLPAPSPKRRVLAIGGGNGPLGSCPVLAGLVLVLLMTASPVWAQTVSSRVVSGVIVTPKNELIPGVTVTARCASGEQTAITDAEGRFQVTVPPEPVQLRVEGKYIVPHERLIGMSEVSENLELQIEFRIPPVHESMVIVAPQLDPSINRRNDAVYKNTLFLRDDQVFQTLDAGINAGQHEGGGKSLEIRRFGFNLDHGGVSGGLKVLVDDVQQNQSTQGHGQGYLGQLKSLTPELVHDVDILNGPFRAEYGDFSGLGVVHIRLRESLAEQFMARIQGGSFGTIRTFLAYSPHLRKGDAFIAYERSRTDGPFVSPLRYKRDNVTGNLTWHLDEHESIGFRLNASRNDFFSSGQIPLDEVAAGRLDRFGSIDPENGGRVRTTTLGTYYRKEFGSGGLFKLDGFFTRSLLDLYSNFTFFLVDEVNGDGIQQHDSRNQEGINAQLIHPFQFLGQHAVLTAGGNFHDNHILVGLYNSVARNPIATSTKARAHVSNLAGYLQQGIDLIHGHLHVDAGLRYDWFRFDVDDKLVPSFSGVQSHSQLQPKFNVAYSPSDRLPLTFYFNYGRGISSQDARGVVREPGGPKISTTDFYQVGTSHNFSRFSLSTDVFLIDRSHEQVYIPDDGSLEFKGPSRAYGFEVKSSLRITRQLSFNGGITKVTNAYYRGTRPRVYVDRAPHVVANTALTLTGWRGFTGSLRYRHASNYRLDGEDPGIRASGHDVLDLSLTKRIRPWIDFNFAIDNLTDKTYYETQNYFESRLRPGDPVVSRIHGTPGYPIGVTAGLTFHFLGK
ncbi:MAG: TonB-dependent receptor [Acidobacteria bacterium]|nr:TonB-dependent receptor [Acidobacteriota bacterium]